MLEPAPRDLRAAVPGPGALLDGPAFSAFCCLSGDRIVMEEAAADFSVTAPHSIQSVTKLHIHLILGQLLAEGRLTLGTRVEEILPWIGGGHAGARVQALLDMGLANDFSEDYADPQADCYAEEVALGWRLPEAGAPEITLREFAASITGLRPGPPPAEADYKSANTGVLTLIAAALSPEPLTARIERIADAAGYEGAFHVSLSKDGQPAFSGGGCLGARDLARFGLLLAREGRDPGGQAAGNAAFLRESLARPAPHLPPPRDWLRYSNHLMTDGRVLGHAGYGGQYLMVDTVTGTSRAFLSVLENDAGYDDAHMGRLASVLREVVCHAAAD